MNMTEFYKIISRIQEENIDIHGEIIDFPTGNANDFLPNFERILLKYAIYRGCYNDDGTGISSRATKLKNIVNKGDSSRWDLLNWDGKDGPQVTYSSASARKHYIPNYRIYVLGQMLKFLAEHKVDKNNYKAGFTFDQAAEKFLDLVKKNNIPQYGWNGAESFMYLLSVVITDRKRAFELKVGDSQPLANDAERLSTENKNLRANSKKEVDDLIGEHKKQVDGLMKDISELRREKLELERKLTEQKSVNHQQADRVQRLNKEVNELNEVKESLMSSMGKGGSQAEMRIADLQRKIDELTRDLLDREDRHNQEVRERAEEYKKIIEQLEKEKSGLVRYVNRVLKALQKLLDVVSKINPALREKVLATDFVLSLGKDRKVPDMDDIYTTEAELLDSLANQPQLKEEATSASAELREAVEQNISAKKAREANKRSGVFGSRSTTPTQGRSRSTTPTNIGNQSRASTPTRIFEGMSVSK